MKFSGKSILLGQNSDKTEKQGSIVSLFFFIVNIKIFDGNKINLWLVLLNIIFK